MNLKLKAFLKRINRTKFIQKTRRWFYFEKKIIKHTFKPKSIDIDGDAYNKLCKIRKFEGCIPTLNILDDNTYDVSIIVPCYNVEPYVKECIESIVNQKTKYKYEIILINDGSTDKTLDIINEYKNISNVVTIDKLNSGLGQSRNMGVESSRGKYIIFVDSDDLVTEFMVEDLMDAATSDNYDMVEADFVNIGGGYKHKLINVKDVSKNKYSYAGGVAWKRIYKKELFKKFSWIEHACYEDLTNAMLLPLFLNKVGYLKQVVYIYRTREDSIMQQTAKLKKIEQVDSVLTKVLLWNYYNENNLKFTKELYSQFIKEISQIVTSRIKNQDEEIKKLSFSVIYNLLNEVNTEYNYIRLPRQLRKMKKIILDKDYYSWID